MSRDPDRPPKPRRLTLIPGAAPRAACCGVIGQPHPPCAPILANRPSSQRSELGVPLLLRTCRAPPNLRPVSKDDHIEFDGVVIEVLTGGMFRVKIDDDHSVIAHLAGKMRKFRIKVVLGDRVKVAVSPYDPNRGRIIYRVR